MKKRILSKHLWWLLVIPLATLCSSYIPRRIIGVYAFATARDTTTITTALTYEIIANPFQNRQLDYFTLVSSPRAGIRVDNPEARWYTVDWNCTASATSNGACIHCGVAVNGTVPDTASVMGTYLKTANEPQAFSGNVSIWLERNDVLTLVTTSDGDGDLVDIRHFTVRAAAD